MTELCVKASVRQSCVSKIVRTKLVCDKVVCESCCVNKVVCDKGVKVSV